MITKKMKSEFLSWLMISVLLITGISCDINESEKIDYHNKILFTSKRSGQNQLYMINLDGTGMRQITSGEYWHRNGRWSPDASKIVCSTEEGSSTAGNTMVVINSDGSDRTLLGYGNQMCWDPGGTKILYTYGPLEVAMYMDLYIIDIDGRNRMILSEEFVGGQTVSPDGTRIALPFNQELVTGIVLLDYPSIDNPMYIHIGPPGAYDLQWSPNGDEIAFSKRELSSSPNEIFTVNSDGSNIRQITTNNSGMLYKFPCFSPGGMKIIFLAIAIDGSDKSYLYMVNTDGTNLHKIIDDDSITSCDWSK
jgi:TolB protein